MKKLEKELQETEAVESQQKKAKLVSVKREITFLTLLQTEAQYMVWVTKSLHDEWTNNQINNMNDLVL